MTTGERAAPFYCPYCGDEGLRMHDPQDGTTGHGQWRCSACQRVFGLRYLGLGAPGQRHHPPRPGSSPD